MSICILLLKVYGSQEQSGYQEGKIRGVSWVGGDSIRISNFDPIKHNNVEWIVQTPFGWMDAHNSTEVHLAAGNGYYWGETDKGIEHTTRLAKSIGVKTLLKPHIWLNRRTGKWRADISMESDTAWDLWFKNYEQFILHYAELAEEIQIEGLCVGTELYYPSTLKDKKFRTLISRIREVYSGQLVYAANWHKEFEEIKFWDDLDMIGIQAYFPLSKEENPELEELVKNWVPHLEKIERISKKFNRKVLFTEVGYRSTSDAAIEPWLWPDQRSGRNAKVSLETQAVCYEALFKTFWNEPWFAGIFIWKWFPEGDRIKTGDHTGFTPQHKPAEEVMSEWYQRSSSRSSIRMAD
jgi:glycosyl hydrolase family 113